MSPLALLQEGEIAEIVDPQKNEFIAHRHGHHRRRQGDTVSISPENHRVNRHFACGISSSNHLCPLLSKLPQIKEFTLENIAYLD